ncbi:hypothetical protein RFI_06157, partial [Reticulomyxa filosa]
MRQILYHFFPFEFQKLVCQKDELKCTATKKKKERARVYNKTVASDEGMSEVNPPRYCFGDEVKLKDNSCGKIIYIGTLGLKNVYYGVEQLLEAAAAPSNTSKKSVSNGNASVDEVDASEMISLKMEQYAPSPKHKAYKFVVGSSIQKMVKKCDSEREKIPRKVTIGTNLTHNKKKYKVVAIKHPKVVTNVDSNGNEKSRTKGKVSCVYELENGVHLTNVQVVSQLRVKTPELEPLPFGKRTKRTKSLSLHFSQSNPAKTPDLQDDEKYHQVARSKYGQSKQALSFNSTKGPIFRQNSRKMSSSIMPISRNSKLNPKGVTRPVKENATMNANSPQSGQSSFDDLLQVKTRLDKEPSVPTRVDAAAGQQKQ